MRLHSASKATHPETESVFPWAIIDLSTGPLDRLTYAQHARAPDEAASSQLDPPLDDHVLPASIPRPQPGERRLDAVQEPTKERDDRLADVVRWLGRPTCEGGAGHDEHRE
jgi:hypothetical protein